MKKTNLVILTILILSAFVVSATISRMPVSNREVLRVTFVSQTPDPVEPGSTVDVRFKVENIGSANAENVEVEILPEYPFTLYSGDSIRQVGDIYGRQMDEGGVIVKYRLKVDERAVAGENQIKFRYRFGEYLAWIEPTDEFFIDVKPQDAILNIVSVESVPERIKPGDSGDLKLTLKNMAEFFVKDIKLKLDLGDKPFAPIGSTNEITIDYMDAKADAIVDFKLMAEPDATSKVYKVPVYITYLDKLGTKYEKNNTIGVVIGDKPDLLIDVGTTTIYSQRKSGEVSVKFVNKGLSDIKLMYVQLEQSPDYYTILSSNNVYVGNIDSDDYETADFKLYVKKANKEGKVILPLNIEYKDSNNVEYKQKYNLELTIFSSRQAKKMGVEKGSNFTGLLIIVVIVAAGLFIYRRKKLPSILKFLSKIKLPFKLKKK